MKTRGSEHADSARDYSDQRRLTPAARQGAVRRFRPVRDAIGREPAGNEVYAALPRSEWRIARQV